MIKSSNGSSGLTVVKFSCKIPIFFSLSHPDGLEERGGGQFNFTGQIDINSVIVNYLKYFTWNKNKNWVLV